jgi:hypothetical protein
LSTAKASGRGTEPFVALPRHLRQDGHLWKLGWGKGGRSGLHGKGATPMKKGMFILRMSDCRDGMNW